MSALLSALTIRIIQIHEAVTIIVQSVRALRVSGFTSRWSGRRAAECAIPAGVTNSNTHPFTDTRADGTIGRQTRKSVVDRSVEIIVKPVAHFRRSTGHIGVIDRPVAIDIAVAEGR